MKSNRLILSFVALTSTACSVLAIDPAACSDDAVCQELYGPSSACMGDGYCSEPMTVDSPKLGFIYSSSQNDKGWSQTHHEAATAVAERLDLELAFRPSVQSPDMEATIDELVEEDARIIFSISSGFITGTLNAANKHPYRTFMSCCGFVSGENITSYFGRMYQPICALGYIAGSMSCTGKLGVVAALPLPQFIRHINAFTLGAREANENIEVEVRFVGAFFDPEAEGARAEELIDAGADVIFAQSNSTAPLEARAGDTVACDEDGMTRQVPIYRVGYHSPTACESNPAQCLSAAYWNWEGLYEELVLSVIEGRFEPDDVDWESMTNDSNSVVNYAPLNAVVPITVSTRADELRARTVADPQVPFRGPILDNTGETRIQAGENLSDQ